MIVRISPHIRELFDKLKNEDRNFRFNQQKILDKVIFDRFLNKKFNFRFDTTEHGPFKIFLEVTRDGIFISDLRQDIP